MTADSLVLVPREATEEMARDGAARHRDFTSETGQYPRSKAVYRAIIAMLEGG